MKTILSAILLAFALTGPLFAESISVKDPYVRAVPPGTKTSAAFMQITNGDKSDHSLVAAESSAAKIVELHTHIQENGMMKMRKIEKIDLPAGQTVELKPGALHVMLIDLNGDLKPGDQVELTLIYDNGEKTKITAPVKEIMMGAMKMDKMGQ
jgi:copper(I)-binding protein